MISRAEKIVSLAREEINKRRKISENTRINTEIAEEIEYNEQIDFDSDDNVADKDYIPAESNSSNFDSDDNVPDKDYIPAESNSSNFDSDDNVPDKDYIPAESNSSNSTERNLIVQQETSNSNRQTKKMTETEKCERNKIKHPIRRKCTGKCRKNCTMLTDDTRQQIWENFWILDYTSRRKWLSKHVQLVTVQRKKQNAVRNRSESRKYSMPLPNLTDISVCRLTFLNTLGYTNDSVITELVAAIKKDPCGGMVKENRGKKSKKQINRSLIVQHIESYHPVVSHYRRYNAPNMRYLPRELTVREMYEDFAIKNPNICRMESYRKILKELNVSLCQPKSDLCDQCAFLKNQENENENVNNSLHEHKIKAHKAILEYKKDSKLSISNAANLQNTKFYSMDLQKVLLLPIMPQIKKSVFISKLVVFNETFAPLNKSSNSRAYCVVWHEALASRKAEQIVDSLQYLLQEERDTKHFIFWADNCTAQNKNWVIFSALVNIVNQSNGPDEVRFKFLTKGHTHMSADGVHGNIEKKIGRKRNIYDFQELCEVIESSRKNLRILKLEQFYQWKSGKRSLMKKKNIEDTLTNFKLCNLVEVKFTKGCRTIEYKNDFDENFKLLDFLKKKENINNVPCLIEHRGVQKKKKETIIKELVQLMPVNRRSFWNNLNESEISKDLVTSDTNNVEE